MTNSLTQQGRQPARYQIKIEGEMRENWSDWLSGMSISLECEEQGTRFTTLVGNVPDQAALRGILCKIWDLNLAVLSVVRIEDDGTKGEKNE